MDPPHSSVLSIESLVAMIRATGGLNPRNDGRNHLKQVQSPSWIPGEGISSDSKTNDRFCKALDAIAALCVSRGRHQVVSIGFQIDHQNSLLTVAIAGNSDIQQDTATYIIDIWAIMKTLSDLYAGIRPSSGHPSGVPWSMFVGYSPDIPRSRQAALIIENLTARVYDFTMAKLMKRIRRWWDPETESGLLHFARVFQKARGLNLEGLEGELEVFLIRISDTVKCLRAHNVDWEMVVKYMKNAVDISDVLLTSDPYWCEKLAVEINFPTPVEGAKKLTFPLRRAIEKLTSHHRYLTQLIAFAHSPRLRLAFSLDVSIQTVPVNNPAGTVQLPSSANEWRLVLEQLCMRHNYELLPGCVKPILEKLVTRCPTAPKPRCVHSECCLVAYYEALRNGPDRYIPPFSYIGVSKLSCKPCHIWLTAFNTRGNGYPKFYTRGTHGKWHYPWSAPVIATWDPGLETLLESEFLKFLNWNGIARSGSDSTVASDTVRWEPDGTEDEIVVKRYL